MKLKLIVATSFFVMGLLATALVTLSLLMGLIDLRSDVRLPEIPRTAGKQPGVKGSRFDLPDSKKAALKNSFTPMSAPVSAAAITGNNTRQDFARKATPVRFAVYRGYNALLSEPAASVFHQQTVAAGVRPENREPGTKN